MASHQLSTKQSSDKAYQSVPTAPLPVPDRPLTDREIVGVHLLCLPEIVDQALTWSAILVNIGSMTKYDTKFMVTPE